MRIKHPTTKRAAIYKQKNSPYWYLDYYIDIDGKTKRKQINSKTEDKDKAFDQLNEIILVNRLVREGKIDLKDTHYKSVNEIAKIIIKTLEPSIKQKPIQLKNINDVVRRRVWPFLSTNCVTAGWTITLIQKVPASIHPISIGLSPIESSHSGQYGI